MADDDILNKVDVLLDANAPDFAAQFAEAIGAKPGDTVQIITPQFTRTDGIVPPVPQINFTDLAKMSPETLEQMGCGQWDEANDKGECLWLLPGEWYDFIPDGFPLVCIDGTTSPFKRGVTDNDIRFGCLAYGVIANAAA